MSQPETPGPDPGDRPPGSDLPPHIKEMFVLAELAFRSHVQYEHEASMPYVLPPYWNGHSVQFGQARPPIVTRRPPTVRTKFKANKALISHGTRSGSGMPIQTFKSGDELEISDDAVGAVYGFQYEAVRFSPGFRVDWENSTWQDTPLPQRPYFGESRQHGMSLTPVFYRTAQMLGVVVAGGRRHPPLLLGAEINPLTRTPHGRFLALSGSVQVGSVDHIAPTSQSPEGISRITHMHQEAAAIGVRKRGRVFGWLGGMATQPSS